MSKWRLGIAVASWMTLTALQEAPKPAQPEATKVQSPPAPVDQRPAISKEVAAGPQYAPYPDPRSEDCYRAKSHDAADLCAQWRSTAAAEKAAGLALQTNWIAGIGAALSALSIVLVVCALAQGRQAHALAEDTAQRELRAYITFKRILTIEDAVGILVAVEWKNGGITPAIRAAGSINIKATPHKIPEDFDFKFTYLHMPGAVSVGPGGTMIVEARDHFTWQEINNASDGNYLYVWGYVEYSDIFDKPAERRRTEFAVQLTRGVSGYDAKPLWRHNGMDGGCLRKPCEDEWDRAANEGTYPA